MKQYTSKDQTAKLIELGFPKPTRTIIVDGFPTTDMLSRYASYKDDFGFVVCYEGYSIGELIGFICNPVIECLAEVWRIEYDGSKGKQFIEEDLIDALYKACIYSKENTQYD